MSYKEWKNSSDYLIKEWTNEKGGLHRDCGPAYIKYNPDGSISCEYFCLNGVIHRGCGPAYIRYNSDGSIWYEYFYLNGKYLGKDKEGFWALWDRIPEEKRISYEILKLLVRYS